METCLFCKIINKTIPAQIIHEDENTLAFLDIYPSTTGHSLIIPKQHYHDIQDLPAQTASQIHTIAQKISQILITKLNYTGTTLLQNNGTCQEIPHYHLHVIGRNKDNSLNIKASEKTANSSEDLTEIRRQMTE